MAAPPALLSHSHSHCAPRTHDTAHTPLPLPLSTRLEIMRKNGMVFRRPEQELTVNLKGAQKTDQ